MRRFWAYACSRLVRFLAWLARYPRIQFWKKQPAPGDIRLGATADGVSGAKNRTVYTYILGDYDTLKEPDILNPRWRYVCYSDSDQSSESWQVTPVDQGWAQDLTPKQVASLLKIEHYNFAPQDSDLVITIDGSMQIHADLDEVVSALWEEGVDMVIAQHPKRDCVYQEAVAVLDKGFDTPTAVCPQMWRYYLQGFPVASGMYGTRMMIKNNRSDSLRRMCELWSREYRRGSCRDQLSLNYAIWKTRLEGHQLNIKTVDFNWLYKESGMFGIRQHNG